MFARWMLRLPFFALICCGCGGSDGNHPFGPDDAVVTFDEPWPTDIESVLTRSFEDGTGDQEQMPPEQAGPPYSTIVPYPAVDVDKVEVGIEGDFLYMRVTFAGTLPTQRVHITAAGEVEEQWVKNQGMNIALNTDGDVGTGGNGEGVQGIDVFFAVGFEYGVRTSVYTNWGFPDGDLHHQQGHALGQIGAGGQGHDFVLVRYDIASLGAVFPLGQTVDVGSWSEAESYDADGSLKYHHFAFDRVIDGETWAIPAN